MKRVLFGMLIVAVAGVAQAGLLGVYDFENGYAAASVDADVVMTDLSTGALFTDAAANADGIVGGITTETVVVGTPDVVNSTNILRVYGDEQGKGSATAITNNDLLSFTISLTAVAIADGKVMNIEEIAFDMQGWRAYSFNTVSIFSSVQGTDDAADDKIGGLSHPGGAGTDDWAVDFEDLTTVAEGANASVTDMQDLTSITFYLAPIQNSTSNLRWQEFDNLTISGSIVPEPATMVLLGLGGLMTLVRRKK